MLKLYRKVVYLAQLAAAITPTRFSRANLHGHTFQEGYYSITEYFPVTWNVFPNWLLSQAGSLQDVDSTDGSFYFPVIAQFYIYTAIYAHICANILPHCYIEVPSWETCLLLPTYWSVYLLLTNWIKICC